MPTRTLVLLLATLGIFVFIVVAIVLSVVLTGNHAAKKADEELRAKLKLYSQEIETVKCPKCGGELEVVHRDGFKTYLKCKNDNCDFIGDPEAMIKKQP